MKELTCAVCKKPADYILHNKYGQPLNICESCYKYLWGPMPLGMWIKQDNGFSKPIHICSECGERALEKLVWIDTVEEVLSNFCPNCGTRMIKEKKV